MHRACMKSDNLEKYDRLHNRLKSMITLRCLSLYVSIKPITDNNNVKYFDSKKTSNTRNKDFDKILSKETKYFHDFINNKLRFDEDPYE